MLGREREREERELNESQNRMEILVEKFSQCSCNQRKKKVF